MQRFTVRQIAGLSIFASLFVILVKFIAFFISGSVSLLSDALESLVNLATAITTFLFISIALQPPDKEHPYGHTKAEYFSSIFEGLMIFAAAIVIFFTAITRIFHPITLSNIGQGIFFSLLATSVNFMVSHVLITQGKKHHSIALEADGHHLMTDVITSIGVLFGLILVSITQIRVLDSLVAMLVAMQIIVTGVRLIQKSISGFMDSSISKVELGMIYQSLKQFQNKGIVFHGLRTRQSGMRRFISFHVLVPGKWSVTESHALVEHIEKKIRNLIPYATITTHIEPVEDPLSWQDENLDRV